MNLIPGIPGVSSLMGAFTYEGGPEFICPLCFNDLRDGDLVVRSDDQMRTIHVDCIVDVVGVTVNEGVPKRLSQSYDL